MGNFFKFALFAGLIFFGVNKYLAPQKGTSSPGVTQTSIAGKLAPDNQIVMYSLTTCGYCTQKRAQLTNAGIPFTEYFLDTDDLSRREFESLLTANNTSGGVGTPSFVVNGVLLLNNPDLDTISQHLKLKS